MKTNTHQTHLETTYAAYEKARDIYAAASDVWEAAPSADDPSIVVLRDAYAAFIVARNAYEAAANHDYNADGEARYADALAEALAADSLAPRIGKFTAVLNAK
jgi:hypothetical protein